jgi:hypothetical protein
LQAAQLGLLLRHGVLFAQIVERHPVAGA